MLRIFFEYGLKHNLHLEADRAAVHLDREAIFFAINQRALCAQVAAANHRKNVLAFGPLE